VDVDQDRLQAKLDYIRARLAQLRETREGGKERFLSDRVLIDATVRRLQTAIEAAVDAALHVVVRENLGRPNDHADAFRLLARAGVLRSDDLPRLLAMVRFRNLAVHLYADVRDEAVWDIVERDLDDLQGFVATLAERYLAPDR
jgi:uncharacterized protein YutE (UPF0331/DUF86 family)